MKTILRTSAAIIALGIGGSVGPAWGADDELRHTVSINKQASVDEVEAALFPKELQAQKQECAQLEKAGLRCQSIIPKSSMDSVVVTFARGSAKLSDEAKDFLHMVGKALQRRSDTWASLVVEGHTDSTGTNEINRRLSKERAETVRDFMQAEYGLKNIQAVGRSSEKLKDAENPGSELNRRIEFIPNW